MIKKISIALIFIFLSIALLLRFAGVEYVEFGNQWFDFIQRLSRLFNAWKFEIPNIPQIPLMDNVGGIWLIIDILASFVNGLVNILNIVIGLLNLFIQLIQLGFTLVGAFNEWLVNNFSIV